MNASTPRIRPRRPYQIANELCELFQQQFDALQQGLAEGELDQYLQRRRQIDELQTQLKTLSPRPS
jgi:hypothetical protein